MNFDNNTLFNLELNPYYSSTENSFDTFPRRHSIALTSSLEDLNLRSYHIQRQQQQQECTTNHRASLPNIFSIQNEQGPPRSSMKRSLSPPEFDESTLVVYQPPAGRRQSIASPEDISAWNQMTNKKTKMEATIDEYAVYPLITTADVEAVKRDPSAIPRRQNKRHQDDQYTPKWVRYTGQLKEGYCDTCQPTGKWLQLKNSAFWYHKQFYHGISSVSGKEFQKPLEQRVGELDIIEGLCHQCKQFVPLCNTKRKNSVLWYRHAHKVNTITFVYSISISNNTIYIYIYIVSCL